MCVLGPFVFGAISACSPPSSFPKLFFKFFSSHSFFLACLVSSCSPQRTHHNHNCCPICRDVENVRLEVRAALNLLDKQKRAHANDAQALQQLEQRAEQLRQLLKEVDSSLSERVTYIEQRRNILHTEVKQVRAQPDGLTRDQLAAIGVRGVFVCMPVYGCVCMCAVLLSLCDCSCIFFCSLFLVVQVVVFCRRTSRRILHKVGPSSARTIKNSR